MSNDSLESRILGVGKLLDTINQDFNSSMKSDINIFLAEVLNCIKQIIENISTTLLNDNKENINSEIDKNLENGIKLLNFLVQFLQGIILQIPLNPQCFQDFPKITACILLEVFGHCKHSESMYGMHFEAMGQKLTNLFKVCQQVQTSYFSIMTVHLQFELSNDDFLQILVEALDILVTVGQIVVSLDVKTMAEQWKGICHIYEVNCEWLQDKYVAERAIEVLSCEISNNINSLMADSLDKKSVTRYLKVSNFILRIMIKFAECFKSSLSTNLDCVVTMICWLELYSKPYLIYLNKQNSFIQEISSNLTVGIEPFLLILIEDTHFCKAYFQLGKTAIQDENLRFGYLLLTIHIIKIFLKSPNLTQQNFMSLNRDENILTRIIKISSNYSEQFLMGLSFEVINKKGDPNVPCFLYDLVLIHVSALAVTFNPEQFKILEKCLCASVLQTNYWRASLAMDVWCALARYGSATLCLDQVIFLVELFEQLNNKYKTMDIPQKMYLACILKRLFNLLPDKHKIDMCQKYAVMNHLCMWAAISFDSIPKQYIEEVNGSLLTSLLTAQKNLICSEITKSEDFFKLVNLMSLASTGMILPEEKQSEITDNILNLWRMFGSRNVVITFYSNCSYSLDQSIWVSKFIEAIIVFSSYVMDYFTNIMLTEITTILQSYVQQCETYIALSALKFLDNLSRYDVKEDSHKGPLCNKIISLFEMLLGSECPVIRILGLDTFARFSHNTNCEDIVRGIALQDFQLKSVIISFLQKKIPACYESSLTYVEYVKEVSKVHYIHKCVRKSADVMSKNNMNNSKDHERKYAVYGNSSLDEQFSVPSKKVKLSCGKNEEIEEIVNRLQNDTKTLLKIMKNVKVTNDINKKLLSIVNNLNIINDTS